MANKQGSRPDIATFAGIALALFGIVGGLVLEKGSIKDIAQGTAALIVLGGTAGAVMITSPFRAILLALSHLKAVFFERTYDLEGLIEEIIGYASKARKQGIVSLEAEAAVIVDPFLKKAMNLAKDESWLLQMTGVVDLSTGP